MLASSYSQASAYVVALRNFQRVRDHLVLSKAGFRQRLSKAEKAARLQPSVFDRVVRIPSDFMPMSGKAYVATDVDSAVPDADQRAFAF